MPAFTKEQIEQALKLPRNMKRRLSPEDRARNDFHIELATNNGFITHAKPKSMATFNDEGELVSLDDVTWFGIDGLEELGLYQHIDEAALAFCRHNLLGEYRVLPSNGSAWT